jgi:hypothetical protein
MASKKRNLEKVEAATVKASKEDKPARFEDVGRELIRLIGRAERGELPVSRRDNDAPKSQARLEFDAHIDQMADRIKHIPPAPNRIPVINEPQTVAVEPERELSAGEFLVWMRNRYKV